MHTWCFFSSVSSALGNKGQVDYSAANSSLDILSETVKANGREAMAIQWGPWSGVGMVSGPLERHYERAGIKLIDSDVGAHEFMSEWNRPDQNAQVILRSWGLQSTMKHSI